MSKTKDKPVEKPRRADAARHQASESSTENPSAWSRTVRETIESVVIAFVLAFLFRTFEAEAFVPPTGSMAPTLMGRHMDLKCPKCGYRFQIGGPDDERTPQETRQEAVCPLCRFAIEPNKDSQYYNGDRILVSKFAFDFVEPKRWDVIVFKFPDDAKTNYIKRLIGLPGEVIRIRDGDIQFSRDGGKTFEMARKDPAKMRAMLQIVYDNDYVYEPFLEKGWPARWQGDPSWTNELRDGKPDYKAFVSDGKSPGGTSGVAWMIITTMCPIGPIGATWKTVGRSIPIRAPSRSGIPLPTMSRAALGSKRSLRSRRRLRGQCARSRRHDRPGACEKGATIRMPARFGHRLGADALSGD